MAEKVESEVKVRVASAEAARSLLAGAGARLLRERHFEDNLLLDDADGSLAAGGCILRIRRTPDAAELTFKAPREGDDGLKHRHEIETRVSDPGAAEALLAALGYRPVFRYQKYRAVFGLGEVEVVLDETPVGTFLELEGTPGAVQARARDLGFGPEALIADSYVGLFRASGGTGDMVFR